MGTPLNNQKVNNPFNRALLFSFRMRAGISYEMKDIPIPHQVEIEVV